MVDIKLISARRIDMLHGSLWDKIILFALPLALTGILQQFLNAADVIVLGKYVGKIAMAAVGNNISLVGLLVSLLMGLGLGANVVIAQNIGAKRFDRVREALSTAFVISLVSGCLFCILAELLVAPIFQFLKIPSEVVQMSEIYLRIFLIGLPAMSLYNFESAILRSKGDTRTPLIALAVASFVNITLNLIFVLKFDLGIAGVAIATVIANFISAVILFHNLIRSKDFIKLDLHWIRVSKEEFLEIVRIGLPAGVQGMVFSLSNILIQAAINSLGADVMAASVAAFAIEMNVFCIINSFGQATTTFVGQNYGAGNLKRCKRVTCVAIAIDALFTQIICGLILMFGERLLEVFNTEPAITRIGMVRLYYVCIPAVINVLIDVISGALRGYGISLISALISLFGVCGIRITWLFTVFIKKPTFEVLMIIYPISWFITVFLLVIAYFYYIKKIKPLPHISFQ